MPLNFAQLVDGIASLAKNEAARQSSFPDGIAAARHDHLYDPVTPLTSHKPFIPNR